MKRKAFFALAAGATLAAGAAALAAPPAELAGDETIAIDNGRQAQFALPPDAQPQGCDTTFYDSGNAFVFNTGRTVGTSSGWEVYQPFMLREDYTLCAIATDGWYVTGTPDTFRGSIFPDNAGTPDINNELAGADFHLLNSGQPHFVQMSVDPICLEANTLYYFGARATGDHWSAIYRDVENGANLMQSFSIVGGNFNTRYAAPPICLKLYGDPGCGSGARISISGDCPGRVVVAWSNATANKPMAIVSAASAGGYVIPGGPCAGTTLGLSSSGLQVNYQGNTGSGAGQVGSSVGTGACGRYVQMVVVSGSPCETSNVVQVP